MGHGGEPANGGAPSDGGSMGPGSQCGDGVKTGAEECDGSDFGGVDCVTFGSNDPDGLKCTDDCAIDTSECDSPTSCGNMEVEGDEECDDGNLLGNDGCSIDCKVEGTCDAPIPVSVSLGAPLKVFGDTSALVDQLDPGNPPGSCDGAQGPELVFRVNPQQAGVLTIYMPSSGTAFDSTLYITRGSSCGALSGDGFYCIDNYQTVNGNNGGEVVSARVAADQPLMVYVDGFGPNDAGVFELDIDLSTGDTCADPVPIMVEGATTLSFAGDLTGYPGNSLGGVACPGAGIGPDLVYDMTFLQSDDYTFELSPSFNSVLYAWEECADTLSEITCSAPPSMNGASFTIDFAENERAFFWVDSASSTTGFYALRVSRP